MQWLAIVLLALGCAQGGSADEADARPSGGADARAGADAGGAALAGFGELSGPCQVLDDELTAASPSLVRDQLRFATAYDMSHLAELSAGGQEMIHDGNAGGSSLLSEVFAYEVLYRCEGAELIKTETEVVYTSAGSKKTDILVRIDGLKVGVSVTRAYVFPPTQPYTVEEARTLIQRKLEDIQASSAAVAAGDRWVKQILHVIAYSPANADTVEQAYAGLAASVRGDTILYVTVTEGIDDFLY